MREKEKRLNHEELEILSNANNFYKGYKAKNKALNLPKHISDPLNYQYGVQTIPSENMKSIVNNQYNKEYLENRKKEIEMLKEYKQH